MYGNPHLGNQQHLQVAPRTLKERSSLLGVDSFGRDISCHGFSSALVMFGGSISLTSHQSNQHGDLKYKTWTWLSQDPPSI